jgi:GT2 family glycosyltransferase
MPSTANEVVFSARRLADGDGDWTPVTPSIDVVIPVRDRWELTERCLEHLRLQTRRNNVIVCDNGSTDGTLVRLAEAFPEVRRLDMGANSGFSIACNRGAREGDAEIVVLVNNDVECHPEFLERLVEPFEADEGVGSVAALLLDPEGAIESFGLTVDRALAGYPRLRGLPSREAQAERPLLIGPSGAAGAYRRAAWEEVGGLDEGVSFYGEDVDLALRIRAAGWSTAAAREAVAVHLGSASATHRSKWQRYHGGFSRGYFLRRYGVLRSRVAARALATEAIVVSGDTLVFSHDLTALRGRLAGWRAASRVSRRPRPPDEAIDGRIGFIESLKRRVAVYSDR